MMKIALLLTSNLENINGYFNNVRTRVKYLNNYKDIELSVFLIRFQNDWLLRLLLGRKKQLKSDFVLIDKIKYNNLWVRYTFIDVIFTYVLGLRDIPCKKQLNLLVPAFSKYDIILAHSFEGKYIAYNAKKKFKIPYINGWHGSDLNIMPFRSKRIYLLHKQLIAAADYNLFVSKKLLEKSNELVDSMNKGVSYSGISSAFVPFDELIIRKLKEEYHFPEGRIIGFVGCLRNIKNVLILPAIFKTLQEKLENVSFVIVGEGNLNLKLRKSMRNMGVEKCFFMGRVESEDMPKIMNCLDLLILPSLNEGLPLVAIEAIACGVPVVGSKVGGISEAIGEQNVFPLDTEFVKRISNRIMEILLNSEPAPNLSSVFSWSKTINDLVYKCEQIVSMK